MKKEHHKLRHKHELLAFWTLMLQMSKSWNFRSLLSVLIEHQEPFSLDGGSRRSEHQNLIGLVQDMPWGEKHETDHQSAYQSNYCQPSKIDKPAAERFHEVLWQMIPYSVHKNSHYSDQALTRTWSLVFVGKHNLWGGDRCGQPLQKYPTLQIEIKTWIWNFWI